MALKLVIALCLLPHVIEVEDASLFGNGTIQNDSNLSPISIEKINPNIADRVTNHYQPISHSPSPYPTPDLSLCRCPTCCGAAWFELFGQLTHCKRLSQKTAGDDLLQIDDDDIMVNIEASLSYLSTFMLAYIL